MIAAPNATTRELAAVGRRSQAGEEPRPQERAYLAPERRQKLRAVPLRDGRVRLVDANGTTFLLCADAKTAAGLKAVFST